MKDSAFTQKTVRQAELAVSTGTSIDLQGVSISPPAYGVDIVDSTRLPETLRAGVEHLSGMTMDDVRVYYNSARPAQLHARAYTEGTQIHVAPGQERHLPHEAWHVVQQKQGRVTPTQHAKGVAINAEPQLEEEADTMGKLTLQRKCATCAHEDDQELDGRHMTGGGRQTIQLMKGDACYCPGNVYSPYWKLPEFNDQIGPGEAFTITQMNDIYAANAGKSFAGSVSVNSLYKSDTNDGALVKLSDVNHMIAEVDHIVPAAYGGCNSVKNAQLISSEENGSKGNSYPYIPYKGVSVFDPSTNAWYANKQDAINKHAKNVGKLP